MNPNFIFLPAGVLITLSMVGTAVFLSQSVDADRGGSPNDYAEEGPASENAEERDERFHDRFPEAGEEGEEDDDCNGKNSCNRNDFGQFNAHQHSHPSMMREWNRGI
jgi:hypothetical protein